ncbi:MAG: Hpt domain-containing protein, partial [Oscillospiraceae bacterium]|nr:Hpt domain-containing protein [Oscillospiraceae bacterium]
MENGLENMLDMYLFETNTMIEQLDEILLSAEKAETFSSDDVNEIFRIMHTIKGSSAMMQFNTLMTVAHQIENLFYCIRENGFDATHKDSLFDLMFKSNDFLKEQVEKIQDNEPLNDNIDSFVEEITDFLAIISASSQDTPEIQQEAAPASEASAEASIEGGEHALQVFFDEGLGMENLRAFILVSSVQDAVGDIEFVPEDVEDNAASSAAIIENGLLMKFKDSSSLEQAISILNSSLNIRSYEVLEASSRTESVAAPEPQEEAPVQASEVQPAPEAPPAPAPRQAAVEPPAHAGHAKQNLISVNLTKLDKLMDIVGELVITEAMVSTNPDLQGLKLDNFMKSSRQL